MDFKLRILGSSSALPTSKRFPTSQVVLYNNNPFLIDCAEGTQRQMRKYKVPFGKINHIFISHLHGDHIYGIFGLLSSFNLLGRKQDLNIYAPIQLKELYETVLQLNNDTLKYKINFFALDDSGKNILYQNKHLKISSFPLIHSKTVFGFLFEEKEQSLSIKKDIIKEHNLSIKQIVEIKEGNNLTINNKTYNNSELTLAKKPTRSYAFCTDTLPLKDLNKYISNIDLLYHEATFASEHKALAKQTFHSTAAQAAEIANITKAKRLIIGHFSSRYKDVNTLLEEACEIFNDTTEAIDGLLIEISNINC